MKRGSGPSKIRLGVVTNIPAPYRVPVFNRVAETAGIELRVFYFAAKEPDREWDLPPLQHDHEFLRGAVFQRRNGRYLHNNPGIVTALRKFDPDVVLTTGFNPTHLYAFLYAHITGRPHIAMTDGTIRSEAGLSLLHRIARREVLGRTDAYVVASEGGRALLRSYGVPKGRIFFSRLCANTTVAWPTSIANEERIDFLFSGRLVEVKNPLFALDVAVGVARRVGRRVSLAILGSGPMLEALRARAAEMSEWVDVRFAGHVAQADVPRWFARARVFLFPTSWDPWGVVANEACLAGVPTLVTPEAGSAGELIVDGESGLIRPLDLAAWIEAAHLLLVDSKMHSRLSRGARDHVAPYNFTNAAGGILSALMLAIG